MSSATYTITVLGRSYSVEVRGRVGSTLSFAVDGVEYSVEGAQSKISSSGAAKNPKLPARKERISTSNEVRAPMPGIVSDLKTSIGATVATGDTVLVIEAMKMENPIRAPRAGTIKEILVTKGQEVPAGALLLMLE